MFCPIFSHFSLEDGEPTTLTRERYLKLREAGFLFWSKGINSTHYSNSPASISTFNPKDTTEVKELKVLIEQQKDIIKEQKTLVSRYSTQIEQFLIWKDELDLKTSSMKDAIDQLQSIIASHEKKITALIEIEPRDNPNPLKRFKKLEGQKHTHSTIQPSKEGEPPKPSEPKDHKSNKTSIKSTSSLPYCLRFVSALYVLADLASHGITSLSLLEFCMCGSAGVLQCGKRLNTRCRIRKNIQFKIRKFLRFLDFSAFKN
jgi:hypothetical protein